MKAKIKKKEERSLISQLKEIQVYHIKEIFRLNGMLKKKDNTIKQLKRMKRV